MRVLLTGAAGFIGSRAAMHLTREGCEVHGIDLPGVSQARLQALAPGARVHEVDLADTADIRELVQQVRPEVAVHLAWYAIPGKYLSAPENLGCVEATLALGRVLAEAGTKRLVTAGTCYEYDTSIGVLSEDAPTAPKFLYSACKLAVGAILREACRGWAMQHCHLRFFYQYGPWEAPGRLVSDVFSSLLRGEEAKVTPGRQILDFLHIDDVGAAISLVARNDVEGVLNVGSGTPVEVRDVVLACARACGREQFVRFGALPARAGDPVAIYADVARLRSLGWRPRLSLTDGMADTLAWYKTRPVR